MKSLWHQLRRAQLVLQPKDNKSSLLIYSSWVRGPHDCSLSYILQVVLFMKMADVRVDTASQEIFCPSTKFLHTASREIFALQQNFYVLRVGKFLVLQNFGEKNFAVDKFTWGEWTACKTKFAVIFNHWCISKKNDVLLLISVTNSITLPIARLEDAWLQHLVAIKNTQICG